MAAIFLMVLNMSITGGLAIIAVMILRLLLCKAPRRIVCLLWLCVALRLVLPLLPESSVSIMPSSVTVSIPHTEDVLGMQSGVEPIERPENEYLSGADSDRLTVTAAKSVQVMAVLGYVWLGGALVMLSYTLVSYLLLRRRVRVSVMLRKGVYLCDDVRSPFICGVIRPKIYLPSDICAEEIECVLAHERAHLTRGDHVSKLIGFLLLSLHWFNPFVWVGYGLFGRDIEIACDEKVIEKLNKAEKRVYSLTLLRFGTRQQKLAVSPLAFGEIGIKERVNMVLSYKKPTVWIILSAVLVCVVSAVILLTNPKANAQDTDGTDASAVDEKQHGYALFCGLESSGAVSLDPIEYITDEDTEIIAELELTLSDMPNGYYISNPSEVTVSFKLSEETVFVFYDWHEHFTDRTDLRYSAENRWVTTNDVDVFLDYLSEYDTDKIKIPFKIETNGTTLTRITEIWVP